MLEQQMTVIMAAIKEIEDSGKLQLSPQKQKAFDELKKKFDSKSIENEKHEAEIYKWQQKVSDTVSKIMNVGGHEKAEFTKLIENNKKI